MAERGSRTTIEVGRDVATLINVFEVAPERQAELVRAWVDMTERIMQHCAGFISANVHASTDGRRVVNYAQWESEKHFQDLLRDPEVRAEFDRLGAIAERMDPHLYTVESIHHS